MSVVNNFVFKSEAIKIRSLQFLTVFVIGFVFSYLGIFFVLFLPLIFLFSPIIWSYIGGWVPKYILKGGRGRLGKIASYLPFVQFKGTWMMEMNSEDKTLNDWTQLKIFLKKYFSEFALINIAIMLFFSNLDLFTGTSVSDFDPTLNIGWYLVIINIMGIIFVVLSIIEDVEIKILDTENENKVNGLIDLSYGLKSLLAITLSIPVINFVVRNAEQRATLFETAVNEILIAALYGIGLPFFMSVIYYQSKFHRSNVNNLRSLLLEKSGEFNLKIGRIQFDELLCNNCDTINHYPNNYCIKCGKNMDELYSPVLNQPVTMGTLRYIDQSDEFTDPIISDIKSLKERLWTTRTKIHFLISVLLPILIYGGLIALLILVFGEDSS